MSGGSVAAKEKEKKEDKLAGIEADAHTTLKAFAKPDVRSTVMALTKRFLDRFVPQRLAFAVERRYYLRTGERELQLLPQLTDVDKVAVDIGGNKGVYTMFLVLHSKRVITFEPNPELCTMLRQRYAKYPVDIVNVALGAEAGKTQLQIPLLQGEELHGLAQIGSQEPEIEWRGNNLNEFRTIDVDIRGIDDELIENVGFVKVDVEGAELNVLKGAVKMLQREQPNLLIECEQRHCGSEQQHELFAFLDALNYAGYYFYKDNLYSIETFKPNEMQHIEWADGQGEYVSNFIFLSRNKPDHTALLEVENASARMS